MTKCNKTLRSTIVSLRHNPITSCGGSRTCRMHTWRIDLDRLNNSHRVVGGKAAPTARNITSLPGLLHPLHLRRRIRKSGWATPFF